MYIIVTCLVFAVALWFLQGQRSAIRQNGKRLPYVTHVGFLNIVDAKKATRRPPGTLPLAGNGLWFLQPRHSLLDWFVGANHQTGFSTFEISVPSLPPAIVISDPKNVEHVLNNNQLFVKGAFFRSRSWDLFGEKSSHDRAGKSARSDC